MFMLPPEIICLFIDVSEDHTFIIKALRNKI